ncbi:putative serine peptidase [Aspergillus udagawae]|uniref:Serine peptidase n=1 Tax=Aspergillus udagawae TaxID=91492 RepID=A0A8E0UUK3_9EURO|nr:uncharacterized protein Aud_000234 [Aspergillus udagawae]GIC84418.1 hypothetical protein Aud_000234 [Aspergillus udagawae]
MRTVAASLTLVASYLCGMVSAIPKVPVPPPLSAQAQLLSGNATFEQYIDHNNPGLGTFPQRFWYNSEHWAGPGSPTIVGRYAKEIKGAMILLEHRYWGASSPYANLTTETLQYLNLEQSIADLVHFAKTVNLPFDTDRSSNADNAPWVLTGGSYSGALAAWTESIAPGTFWAYHASSAPVEAIYDFWQYFVPVIEGMPKNCSKDLSRVVKHIDHVYKSGDIERQQELKEMFGLGGLKHFDDFAAAIENGPWLWQSNTFYTGYSGFFKFCDAVENVTPGAKRVPGPSGVGLEKALKGYASWFNSTFLPGYCAKTYGYWTDDYAIDCFDTYTPSNPLFTDLSPSNTINRQWVWFTCNEPFFYWQDGAPKDEFTIVSRLVSAEYWQRQCSLYFPELNGYTYGSAKGKTAGDVNKWTKGWDLTNTTRLIWTNGQFDPWRDSGVSSKFRPGGPLQSTEKAPVQVIPGGFHCSDLRLRNGAVNAGVQKVIDNEVAQIKAWVAEYPKHQKP